MKFVALPLIAITAALPTSATAQTMATSFNGPRFEGRIGWDRPTIDGSLNNGANKIERSFGKNGVTYGGEVGYDATFDQLAVGAYAGFEASTAKYCSEVYGNDRGCVRAGRNFTVGGRLGYVTSPSVMLYFKGGYSNTKAKIDYLDYDLESYDFKASRTFSGFHSGAGIEATLNGGIYTRLEYVYSGYGEKRIPLEEETGVEGLSGGFSPRRHQVVFAMGYRF